jgi:hypothetical protein
VFGSGKPTIYIEVGGLSESIQEIDNRANRLTGIPR